MNSIYQPVSRVARAFGFVLLSLCFCVQALGQGTAFTYQGRLDDSGNPANGSYDFRFAIYDSSGGGGRVAGPVTNSAVAVNNGGFVVNLDFGPGVFTGAARWLDISVRTNGSTNAFAVLSPRQLITPTPYGIFANTAYNLSGTLPTAQLTGLLPATQLSGTLPASAFAGYTNTVALTNSANLFAGSFSGSFVGAFNGAFNGTFSGNGGSVTNVNVTHLTGVLADSQLPANAAFVNSNQIFTGANNFTGQNSFSGANTFTNFGNSFVGSFFGNGAMVGWIPTNGTAIQAEIYHGYLLTSPQLVTVTLPASSQPGNIVRISGAGARGWVVNESSGQSIVGNFANYGNSYLVGPSSSGNYHDVAASAGGIPIYAVGSGFSGVYVSYDYGRSWKSASATFSPYCQSVACSANGQIVYAVSTSGVLYESADSGATWSAVGSGYTTISCTADGSQVFTGNIACSGNGTFLAYFSGSSIYVSTNGGSSWSTIPAPSGTISCLAVSSDCTRLIAGVYDGRLYGSANSGATWTPITASNQYWSGAWMSADGSRFAATVGSNGSTTGSLYDYRVDVQSDSVSTNSTISGSQGTAVELQAIGNNQWMPVSSTGTIWAY